MSEKIQKRLRREARMASERQPMFRAELAAPPLSKRLRFVPAISFIGIMLAVIAVAVAFAK